MSNPVQISQQSFPAMLPPFGMVPVLPQFPYFQQGGSYSGNEHSDQSPRPGDVNKRDEKAIFLGGLPGRCKALELKAYFEEKFDCVAEVKLSNKRISNNELICKGFGFLRVSSDEAYQRILDLKQDYFQDRLISFRSFSQGDQLKKQIQEKSLSKIYLKVIPSHISIEDLLRRWLGLPRFRGVH